MLALAGCSQEPPSEVLPKFTQQYVRNAEGEKIVAEGGDLLTWRNVFLGSCRSGIRTQVAIGVYQATEEEVTSKCECDVDEVMTGKTLDELTSWDAGAETGICNRYLRDMTADELRRD